MLVAPNAKPVPVTMVVKDPGVYQVYATNSPRWVGREAHLDKSEQPINLATFCIPGKLFMTKHGKQLVDEATCIKVRVLSTISFFWFCVRRLFANCGSCACVWACSWFIAIWS